MPLGAMRIGYLANKFSIVGAFTELPISEDRDIDGESFSYLGNDSNNNPVFAVSYSDANDNQYPKVILLRFKSNYQIDVGSPHTVTETSNRTTAVCSEHDYPLNNPNANDYIYYSFAFDNGFETNNTVCLEYDRDTLSIVSQGNTLTASYTNVGCYNATVSTTQSIVVVNGRGGNNGTQMPTSVYERTSGTNLTTLISRSDTATNGQGGRYDLIGFDNKRYVFSGRGNNGNNHNIIRCEVQSSSISSINDLGALGGGDNSGTRLAPLNDSNKLLVVGSSDGTTRTSVVEVTDWNTLAATEGNITTIENSNTQDYEAISGFDSSEAYILEHFNGDLGAIRYKKVSVSGVTSTVDTDWTIVEGLNPDNVLRSSVYIPFFPVSRGNANYLTGITRNNNKIYFIGFSV